MPANYSGIYQQQQEMKQLNDALGLNFIHRGHQGLLMIQEG
jgi:hypothetical protein